MLLLGELLFWNTEKYSVTCVFSLPCVKLVCKQVYLCSNAPFRRLLRNVLCFGEVGGQRIWMSKWWIVYDVQKQLVLADFQVQWKQRAQNCPARQGQESRQEEAPASFCVLTWFCSFAYNPWGKLVGILFAVAHLSKGEQIGGRLFCSQHRFFKGTGEQVLTFLSLNRL